MSIVDPAIVRLHFARLDPVTCDLLMTTLVEDMEGLGENMLAAVKDGDEQGTSAARHALRGLCGSFGAVELERLLSTDLTAEGAGEAFGRCLEETIQQIRAAAACG